jgi:uncharacterized glyoxalase superfamily metalloenzyme YdcJ
MYAREVPLYQRLVDLVTEINQQVMMNDQDKLQGEVNLARISAERHGAIRLGLPQEMHDMGVLFEVMGMYPVGFYDLTTAAKSIPVNSTAFRPIEKDELAKNPFRVFTSLLQLQHRQFFDEALAARAEAALRARDIFSPLCRELMQKAQKDGGLNEAEGIDFVREAIKTFEWDTTHAVDKELYDDLFAVSEVAADIAAFPNPHINHLTPRVLDIDLLYSRMKEEGIAMIDTIQGPPALPVNILLRQTSYQAMDEPRTFTTAHGLVEGSHRARFGEIEQRGIAITPEARALYDEGKIEIFPDNYLDMAKQELAYFEYAPTPKGTVAGPAARQYNTIIECVEAGFVSLNPITYEDFLPKSAAGIFMSNLSSSGSRNESEEALAGDVALLSDILKSPIFDPYSLYAAQEAKSVLRTLSVLKVTLSPEQMAAYEKASQI